MSGCDIVDVAQTLGERSRVHAESPPSAVAGQPQNGRSFDQASAAVVQQLGGHLRGVHPDLQYRLPADGRGVAMRVGQPISEVVAALVEYDERCALPAPYLGGAGGGVQLAGERHDSRSDRGVRHRVEGV